MRHQPRPFVSSATFVQAGWGALRNVFVVVQYPGTFFAGQRGATVAQQFCKLRVAGSNPVAGSMNLQVGGESFRPFSFRGVGLGVLACPSRGLQNYFDSPHSELISLGVFLVDLLTIPEECLCVGFNWRACAVRSFGSS